MPTGIPSNVYYILTAAYLGHPSDGLSYEDTAPPICPYTFIQLNKRLHCPTAGLCRAGRETLHLESIAASAPLIRALLDCVARYKFIYNNNNFNRRLFQMSGAE